MGCVAWLLLLLGSAPDVARATCSATDLLLGAANQSYDGPADASMIGRQIGTGWGGTASAASVFVLDSCSSWAKYSFAAPTDTPVSDVTYSDGTVTYPVYPTGVPGIGYVLGLKDSYATQWVPIAPPQSQTFPAPGTGTGSVVSLGWNSKILFVATGQLRSGVYSLPAKRIARLWATDPSRVGQLTPDAYIQFTGASITVSAASCTVTSAGDQEVPLPAVLVSDFKGVGTSPSESASFSVGVQCDPGIAVYATMTDATTPTNQSDLLNLDASSTASGVRLQIYRNGLSTPISYGPESSAKGNPNQWFVGNSSSATRNLSIPFTVKYVQSGTATPGSVKAAAVITFSYQ